METYWKPLVAPILVGLALLFAGYVGRVTTPEPNVVIAESSYFDVANPLRRADIPDSLFNLAMVTYSNQRSSYFLAESFITTRDIRVGSIKLTNTTNSRSQPIEISANYTTLFSPQNLLESQAKDADRVKTRPLDPRATVTVYYVGFAPFSSKHSDEVIKVIHDNKIVDLQTASYTKGGIMIADWAIRSPIAADPIAFFVILTAGFFLAILTAAAVIQSSDQMSAYFLSAAEIKRFNRLVEIVRTKYPDRLFDKS